MKILFGNPRETPHRKHVSSACSTLYTLFVPFYSILVLRNDVTLSFYPNLINIFSSQLYY